MKKHRILDIGYWILNIPHVSEGGFTLVEMLAVMIIFIAIGTIIVAILTTTFRTSQKTDVLTTVRQNGNYAISQMAKTIRDARALVDPFPCSPAVTQNSLTITTPDDQQVVYSCSNNTISSNSASLIDSSAVSVSSCSFTCSQESDSDLPLITISLGLQQKSASTFAEQKASASAIPFQTSIVLRNINR